MNLIPARESKKIAIVIIILVVLLALIVFVRWQKQLRLTANMNKIKVTQTQTQTTPMPKTSVADGSYTIKLEKNQVKTGEDFTAKIIFSAQNKLIAGSDVYLLYDPAFLAAAGEVSTGSFFSSYPRKTVDNAKGMIKVTGFSPVKAEALREPVDFMTVVFTAKKAGRANISFDFKPGTTNLTTLVEKGTGRNILGKTDAVVIVIKP